MIYDHYNRSQRWLRADATISALLRTVCSGESFPRHTVPRWLFGWGWRELTGWWERSTLVFASYCGWNFVHPNTKGTRNRNWSRSCHSRIQPRDVEKVSIIHVGIKMRLYPCTVHAETREFSPNYVTSLLEIYKFRNFGWEDESLKRVLASLEIIFRREYLNNYLLRLIISWTTFDTHALHIQDCVLNTHIYIIIFHNSI